MKTPLTLCHPLLSCDSYSPNATCAADGTESIVVIHMQISVYSSYAKCIRAEHPNFGRTPTKTRTVSEWHPVVLSTWQNKEGNSVFYLSACCEIHSTLLHSFLAIKKKTSVCWRLCHHRHKVFLQVMFCKPEGCLILKWLPLVNAVQVFSGVYSQQFLECLRRW